MKKTKKPQLVVAPVTSKVEEITLDEDTLNRQTMAAVYDRLSKPKPIFTTIEAQQYHAELVEAHGKPFGAKPTVGDVIRKWQDLAKESGKQFLPKDFAVIRNLFNTWAEQELEVVTAAIVALTLCKTLREVWEVKLPSRVKPEYHQMYKAAVTLALNRIKGTTTKADRKVGTGIGHTLGEILG
jgi:hypothetical protein